MKLFKLYIDDFNELCIPYGPKDKTGVQPCFCFYQSMDEWRIHPRPRGYITRMKLDASKCEKLINFIFESLPYET
jgi:hypothetical protein